MAQHMRSIPRNQRVLQVQAPASLRPSVDQLQGHSRHRTNGSLTGPKASCRRLRAERAAE